MMDKLKINDVVKVEDNERDGYYLILTKKRSEVLKKELLNIKSITIDSKIDYQIKTDTFLFKDNPSGTNTKIFIPDVNKKSEELISHILMMKKKSKFVYN